MKELQLAEVEKFVNDAISAKASVSFAELPKTEAKESGVSENFWDKYPDIVKVYTIQDVSGKVWSREVCGGSHVENTECLVRSRIVKEHSSLCWCAKEQRGFDELRVKGESGCHM